MKKTDEIVWGGPLADARHHNTSNNELMGFEKFLSTLICCCVVFGRGSGWG